MSSHIFRIFKPDESKEDRIEKRKAQLRGAQKTYRNRRDKYTRSLEEEVARVQASEADLLREVKRLRQGVAKLEATLCQHGLDVPNVVEDIEVDASLGLHTWTDVSSPESPFGPGPKASHLSTAFTLSPADSAYQSQSSPQSFSKPSPDRDDMQLCLGGGSQGILVPSPTGARDVRVCDTDPAVVGMEFVLTLERPCLGHLHGNLDKPDEPGGHALTATAHLLAVDSDPKHALCHTSLPGSPARAQPTQGMMCSNVPSALLENLLGLSAALGKDDAEVTPVQAWNYIRCRPQFGGLGVLRLGKLAEKLRDAVKCHGFGAVVNRRIFEGLVLQLLLDGQPF